MNVRYEGWDHVLPLIIRVFKLRVTLL